MATTKICLQDLGSLSEEQELLERDWIPLTKQGKNVFADVLANLESFTLEVMEERGDDDLKSSEEVMARKRCGVIQTRYLISNIRQKGAAVGPSYSHK